MSETTPRIRPLEPPYEPAVEESLGAMMPRQSPVPPLRLFRTLAVHPRLAEAMHGLGRFVLGRDTAIGLRERELMIDRTCARCGCEYEWGVHATFFAARAGFTPAQIAATVRGGEDPGWSDADRLVIRLADQLHDDAAIDDDLWRELSRRWTEPQIMELILIAGWYHAISYVANGLRIEREEWAERCPE